MLPKTNVISTFFISLKDLVVRLFDMTKLGRETATLFNFVSEVLKTEVEM